MKPRKLSRRKVLASIPPALLLPTVAGCIPQIGSTGPTSIRVLVPQLQDSVIDTMADRVKALLDDLNQGTPNLKFELAKLPTTAVDYAGAVATQTGSQSTIPDLVIANLGDVPGLVDRGLLLPLDRYVRDDRDVKLDDFYPSTLAPNKYKGSSTGCRSSARRSSSTTTPGCSPRLASSRRRPRGRGRSSFRPPGRSPDEAPPAALASSSASSRRPASRRSRPSSGRTGATWSTPTAGS
jgi:hypothetical protein